MSERTFIPKVVVETLVATSDGAQSVATPDTTPASGEAEKTPALAGSPFDDIPDDALIHVLSWLKMEDMVSASHVSMRWRQIALSTASLWRDVDLTKRSMGSNDRCTTIASRSRESDIDFKVVVSRSHGSFLYSPMQMKAAAQRILRQHSHHMASLEFNNYTLMCSDADAEPCSLASVPIFQDAVKRGQQVGLKHGMSLRAHTNASVRFPDLHTMRTVELHGAVLTCPLSLSAVTDVRLLEFGGFRKSTLERVSSMFPGMTSLTISDYEVTYFAEENAMEHFIGLLGRVNKLSLTANLFDEQVDVVCGVLHWPVRTLELNVSTSGNSFARRTRRILRELLTADSVLAVRSTRQRDAQGEWKAQYTITLRIGSSAGREFIFVIDSFTRGLQNYVAPLVREKLVQEVLVDGHAACALFYAACGTSDLVHIKTLRIVASDPNSIRIPQKQLRLSGLKELVLEKDPMRSSRITAATVEGLVSGVVTDQRVSLRLKDVFVYAEGDEVEIEQYVDLVEGLVRPPSWRQLASFVVADVVQPKPRT